jgi:hypothetical protein
MNRNPTVGFVEEFLDWLRAEYGWLLCVDWESDSLDGDERWLPVAFDIDGVVGRFLAARNDQ